MPKENTTSTNIEMLLSDFLIRYGERGRAVLEAAIRATNKLAQSRSGVPSLPGDFDYRSLVEELGVMGYSYNPSPILRILEREYGFIKTTLHTSRQRWFVFSSREIREIIENYIINTRENLGDADPDLLITKIQLISVMPEKIKTFLEKLTTKNMWSEADYKKLRKLSKEELPLLRKIYKKASGKDDESWQNIAREIEEIFKLLNKVIVVAYRRGSEKVGTDDIEELEETLEKFAKDQP